MNLYYVKNMSGLPLSTNFLIIATNDDVVVLDKTKKTTERFDKDIKHVKTSVDYTNIEGVTLTYGGTGLNTYTVEYQ